MAKAPATTTGADSDAAGLVEAGPTPRYCTPRVVGIAADAGQNVRRRNLVIDFQQRGRDRRTHLGPPPRRPRRGRAGGNTGGGADTPPQDGFGRGTSRHSSAKAASARAGDAKRLRGSVTATTRPAPTATSTTSGASSSQLGASSSFPAPYTVLAARLGQALGTSNPVTRRNGRPGDRAFLQGSVVYMSGSARSVVTCDQAMAVIHSAQALLLELPVECLISVDAA